MTIDQRARASADSVRELVATIARPEPAAVVRRARRRRRTHVSIAALVAVVVVAATVAAVDRGGVTHKVDVSGSTPDVVSVPSTDGKWLPVSKSAAGLGAGVSLHALAADGSTLLLGGDRPGNGAYVVTMWWSDDGSRWTESAHPTEHDSISAIATHDNTALAIGAPGGPNAFVWRSTDKGRHWEQVASGPVFGATVPNSRPGAIVSGVLWHDGWWVAYGGAADGWEAIWISRDGATWTTALDSHASGSIDGVVETGDGSLLAYAVGAGRFTPPTIEMGWFTSDPTQWGTPVGITTPDRHYLQSVTAGARLAVGNSIDHYAAPGRVLTSADGGHTWVEDSAFHEMYMTAMTRAATTTAGLDVVAGSVTGYPFVWLSAGSAWVRGPDEAGPPKGELDLVASAGNRIVAMSRAATLDRYYVYDVVTKSVPVASEATVPGLAAVMQSVRAFASGNGSEAYSDVVATAGGKADAFIGGAGKPNLTPVYIVRMVGRFACAKCGRPPGDSPSRGTEFTFVVARSGQILEWSLGDTQMDLSGLGVVYRAPAP